MRSSSRGPNEGSEPALVRLCHSLANAHSLPRCSDAVVGALVSVTGFERASALAFDGAGVMRFRASHGLSEHYRRAVDGPLALDPRPPWMRCRSWVDDVRLAPDLAALQPVFAAENIRALAFLPLVGGGRLLGKFMLYADRPIGWREGRTRLRARCRRPVGQLPAA